MFGRDNYAFKLYRLFDFFPIILLVFYLIPAKVRHVWLLVASYYFYFCWEPRYVILLLLITGIIYIIGLFLVKIKRDSLRKTLFEWNASCFFEFNYASIFR